MIPSHLSAAVPCPSCGRSTILTIAHAYTITLYGRRDGITQRTLGKRQCLQCGGGDRPDLDATKP